MQNPKKWQHQRLRHRKGVYRRIKLIDQEETSQSRWSSDEENAVLHLEGNGVPSFKVKGKINNERFETMIDSG